MRQKKYKRTSRHLNVLYKDFVNQGNKIFGKKGEFYRARAFWKFGTISGMVAPVTLRCFPKSTEHGLLLIPPVFFLYIEQKNKIKPFHALMRTLYYINRKDCS